MIDDDSKEQDMAEDTRDKSSYDGRRYYFKQLMPLFEQLAYHQHHSNYVSWAKVLRSICSKTMPYADPAQVTKVLDKLVEVNKLIRQRDLAGSLEINKQNATIKLENALFEVGDALNMMNKDLMLPVRQGDDHTDFSADDFDRGSSI